MCEIFVFKYFKILMNTFLKISFDMNEFPKKTYFNSHF